jgi:hypothetical protein
VIVNSISSPIKESEGLINLFDKIKREYTESLDKVNENQVRNREQSQEHLSKLAFSFLAFSRNCFSDTWGE